MDKVIAAAWRLGGSKGLLVELRSECPSSTVVTRLLKLVLLGASGSVSTWKAALSAVEKFESWLLSHAFDTHSVSGPRLAAFLDDQSLRGSSIPRSSLSGLTLFSSALLLEWPVSHPLVIGVCKVSQRQAAEQRASKASESPRVVLTITQLMHLERIGCSESVPLGIRWGALLGCLLAHACLRFSDAQRSDRLSLGTSSIYGFCWRSKRCRMGFPFAALRKGYSCAPWADVLVDLVQKLLAWGIVADFAVPQFGKDLELPLPRPGTYACCVGLFRRALQLAPLSLSESDACGVTLHACRRLLPTLASQLLMSLESRRVMGHWAPNSQEPVRYDSSRCVSELAYKAQVAEKVSEGWRPSNDFEVARASGSPPVAVDAGQVASQTIPETSVPVNGWMSVAQKRNKLRCLHILASPGVTACGWAFGTKSNTGKEFFAEKPDASAFAMCGGCSATKAQRELLADAGHIPMHPSVPPSAATSSAGSRSSSGSARSASRVSSSSSSNR